MNVRHALSSLYFVGTLVWMLAHHLHRKSGVPTKPIQVVVHCDKQMVPSSNWCSL
ncbi:hypothetical protein KC19_4G039900 [Ceratodon purpureus]|uniref:Uncharacterized protein n=1 Tax=Ceratodon purpureus TaxID=3225 RepID=A0A8T0I4Z7_CERPU|nr:hypothetical protein KC19_4G039900 [Ceratodon purpureus]